MEELYEFRLNGQLVTVILNKNTTEPAEFMLNGNSVNEMDFTKATGWTFDRVVDAILDGTMQENVDS